MRQKGFVWPAILPVVVLGLVLVVFSLKLKPAAILGISSPVGSGFSAVTVKTEKGSFRASLLSIDLSSARVVTDTANDSDCADNCPTLTLRDFVNRRGGFAGVNGTYFCPATYPECGGKKNAMDQWQKSFLE